jgi:hypothetical protein
MSQRSTGLCIHCTHANAFPDNMYLLSHDNKSGLELGI